jgi:hypothetical protein
MLVANSQGTLVAAGWNRYLEGCGRSAAAEGDVP